MAKVIRKTDTGPIYSMEDGDVAELVTGININNDIILEKGTVIQRRGLDIIVIGEPTMPLPSIMGCTMPNNAWNRALVRILPKGTLIQL